MNASRTKIVEVSKTYERLLALFVRQVHRIGNGAQLDNSRAAKDVLVIGITATLGYYKDNLTGTLTNHLIRRIKRVYGPHRHYHVSVDHATYESMADAIHDLISSIVVREDQTIADILVASKQDLDYVTVKLVSRKRYHYLHVTLSGTWYNGMVAPRPYVNHRKAAGWILRRAAMYYGPIKYVKLLKKLGGIRKGVRLLKSFISEEQLISGDITKKKINESQGVKALGKQLGVYALTKVAEKHNVF